MDENVHFYHTSALINALIEAGKPYQLQVSFFVPPRSLFEIFFNLIVLPVCYKLSLHIVCKADKYEYLFLLEFVQMSDVCLFRFIPTKDTAYVTRTRAYITKHSCLTSCRNTSDESSGLGCFIILSTSIIPDCQQHVALASVTSERFDVTVDKSPKHDE